MLDEVIEWLNDNSGAVQAIATAVLVGVTSVYVYLTHRIASATRHQADATRKQADATRRVADATLTPILEQWLRADYPLPDTGRDTALEVLYKNVGNGPAVKIRWMLSRLDGMPMDAPIHKRNGMGASGDGQVKYVINESHLQNGALMTAEYASLFGDIWKSTLSLPTLARDGNLFLVNGEPSFERILKRTIEVTS